MKCLVYTLLAFVMIIASGCGSTRLPPRITEADRARITPLDLTVGVERYQYPAHSKALQKNLRQTKLFTNVDSVYNLSLNADLYVEVEEHLYEPAIIPCISFFTLGIIPNTVTAEAGEVISFISKKDPTRKVRVEYRYESKSVLGWAGLFLNLSPNWSINQKADKRYVDGLALAISKKSEAILQLIEEEKRPNHGLESTSAPPAAGTLETHP